MIDVAAYLTAKVLVSKGALYQPFVSESYEAHYAAYLETRDGVLGWSADPAKLDSSDSRMISAFPDPERHGLSFQRFRDTGFWPHQPLIDELTASEIVPLDFDEHLLRHAGSGDPCALFATAART